MLEHIKLALLPDKLRALVDRKPTRAPALSPPGSAWRPRVPPPAGHSALRRSPTPRPRQGDPRDPQVLLIDEPFAGLTATEAAAFSDLICGFRAESHAVLLVDHNVKGVAPLVDRVLAMYLGERIAEGTAEEVMRDETVRRVYLGGSIETAVRPRNHVPLRASPPLEVDGLSVLTARRRGWKSLDARR